VTVSDQYREARVSPDQGAGAGRTGRPPLTERRRAATRLEIAREAVRLFTAKGVAATSAEEIAGAAGISVRTLWRYFPTKESCVLPLLTGGIELTAGALRAWRPGGGVTELLDDLERSSDTATADVATLINLVRLTRTDPALRAVWLQAHDDAEPIFATVLAERAVSTQPGHHLSVKVRATMINSALRAAVEHYADHTAPADVDATSLSETVRAAMLTAAQGFAP
jgi:AcrR family transcriptional regulator